MVFYNIDMFILDIDMGDEANDMGDVRIDMVISHIDMGYLVSLHLGNRVPLQIKCLLSEPYRKCNSFVFQFNAGGGYKNVKLFGQCEP